MAADARRGLSALLSEDETIDGIAIDETPNFADDVVVAADFSSTILSAPIDVSRYGVIYAGAQKNIGPAG